MTTIDLPEDLAAAHALIMVLHKSNHELTGEVASLEHRLDVMARRMFGRRSEQLDVAQLKLAFSALGGGEENEVVAQDVDVPDTPDPGEPATRTRQQRRTHGRKKLPTHLPREERVVEPETTSCPCCDRKMKCMGEERSEQLEYVPASYKVIETIRPKYACGHCKEGVYVALAPEAALARCKAGPGLLAKVVVSKYADHLPLYRQREIYEREGVELSERTLGGWIRQVATALAPIARAQWRSILGSKVLGADETTLRYLTPGKRGSKSGWLWAYLGDQREVHFEFTPGRGGDAPLHALRSFRGEYLQVDGYAGYNRASAPMTRVGCWAHARRKFYDAQKNDAARSIRVLTLIGCLYGIEKRVRQGSFEDEAERMAALAEARATEGVPKAESLKELLDAYAIDALPQSPLGKAVTYARNNWAELTEYLNDAEIPIDNNAVERQMRAVAVGRKNYLFCGSRASGRNAAVLYGLMGTCKLHGVNAHTWLVDVLERLPRTGANDWALLTPRIWAKEHPTDEA